MIARVCHENGLGKQLPPEAVLFRIPVPPYPRIPAQNFSCEMYA
jgi:hypothetical protein